MAEQRGIEHPGSILIDPVASLTVQFSAAFRLADSDTYIDFKFNIDPSNGPAARQSVGQIRPTGAAAFSRLPQHADIEKADGRQEQQQHHKVGQPDRGRTDDRRRCMQQVDAQDHLVHANADQNVKDCQQARHMQLQPGLSRYPEMCGDNAEGRGDGGPRSPSRGKKKTPGRQMPSAVMLVTRRVRDKTQPRRISTAVPFGRSRTKIPRQERPGLRPDVPIQAGRG